MPFVRQPGRLIKRPFLLLLTLAAFLLATSLMGCGGSGGGDGGGTPTPTPSPTPTPTPSPIPTPTPTPTSVPPVVSVTLSPTTATLTFGMTEAFAATVTGTSDTSVTWSVEEGPSGGSITSAGVYTAPSTAGSYHVVATSHADSTKTGVAIATVQSGTSSVTVN